LGYYSKEDWVTEKFKNDIKNKLLIQRISPTSTIPTRATEGSIGYDLCLDTAQNVTIPPGTIMPMPTGLAIQCPTGTYARIAPRSGLTIRENITTLAGVIDPDYRGNVTVLVQNFGTTPSTFKPGQKIAQLILENAITPPINVVNDLVATTRGDNGFGSTDMETTTSPMTKLPIVITDKLSPHIPASLPFFEPKTTNHAAAARLFSDIQTTFDRPFDLHLSHDPYDNHTSRKVTIRPTDTDDYYGLNIVTCDIRNIPKLVDCKAGTSSIRIPRWRSELRDAYIIHINGTIIHNMTDIQSCFAKIRNTKQNEFSIGFSTISKQAMHPQLGVPQLYHDQMNIIGEHLWDIAHDPLVQSKIREELALPITPAKASKITKLTRQKLGKDKFWALLNQLPQWYKISALKKSCKKKLT
jgi:dUTP pyrophosphatase